MNPNSEPQNQIKIWERAPILQTINDQPFDIIRTETVLSKYQIHNIGEKGSKAGINIIKT